MKCPVCTSLNTSNITTYGSEIETWICLDCGCKTTMEDLAFFYPRPSDGRSLYDYLLDQLKFDRIDWSIDKEEIDLPVNIKTFLLSLT